MSIRRVLALAMLGAGASTAAAVAVESAPQAGSAASPDLVRTNFRGRTVLLAGGPALTVGASLAATAAGRGRLAVLVSGVGLLGEYDDLFGQVHARGLRGHFQALRAGSVTTGSIKVVGLVALGFACAPAGSDGAAGRGARLTDAALIAGTANLVNLLDLRPGRALKALTIGAAAVAAMDPAGSAVLLGPVFAGLPDDLGERSMLGDCGANAGGAALGWLAARSLRVRGRLLALGAVIALTLASERVSFSSVIERNRLLAGIDGLGRT